jgi:hypothetical protein
VGTTPIVEEKSADPAVPAQATRPPVEADRSRFLEVFGETVCADRPFYNFGSGNWAHPLWRNIDIVHPKYPQNQPEIVYDAMTLDPLPIATDSARLFFFSHVNEHLDDEMNTHVLSEVYRSLAPGGMVRLVFPDFDLATRAHREGDRSFFLKDWNRAAAAQEERKDRDISSLLLDFFATRAQIQSPVDGNVKLTGDQFHALIRDLGYEGAAQLVSSRMSLEAQAKAPGLHINWWNYNKMRRFLQAAGFAKVERSAFLQSACPALRDRKFFDKTQPAMSCYVEAWA